jgi:hypothetical protein
VEISRKDILEVQAKIELDFMNTPSVQQESRGWYYKGRYILGENVIHHRLQLLSEIIRLLLTMVPQQRGYVIRDEIAPYLTKMGHFQQEISINENMEYLLKNVPLPTP